MASTGELAERALALFREDAPAEPPMTLRGGDALDGYDEPPAFDAERDEVTDAYLNRHAAGVAYLDPRSWRHYLPHLIELALRTYRDEASPAVDALVRSLRPPDRDPPRLGSLTPEQEDLVVDVLEKLAFEDGSLYVAEACQALEEYWIDDPLYRPE